MASMGANDRIVVVPIAEPGIEIVALHKTPARGDGRLCVCVVGAIGDIDDDGTAVDDVDGVKFIDNVRGNVRLAAADGRLVKLPLALLRPLIPLPLPHLLPSPLALLADELSVLV